ncbi:MAG: FAD-dependent oxidoreductase [Candidatus Portnoybacteria bacterium]|nr:FAD-dependent oxidoreductase [Candidatus Portnoybacteria bacterium]
MAVRKAIVILGAGFGGVRCALTLEKLVRKARLENIRIVLIDKNRYHTFIPALYEVASAAPSVSEDALYHRVNILIKHLVLNKRIEFIKAEIASIETEKHYVLFADGNGVDFDYLVIALGAQTNFYDIPGLKEHGLELKDFVSAVKIRRSVKLADEMPKMILIGGGGTTGVELSAELTTCFRGICPRIMIVQGDKRLLSKFPENISELTQKRLHSLGVEVKLDSYIKEVKENEVMIASGDSLPYERLFWTGGITGNSLFASLRFQKEKGFFKVDECLRIIKENGNPKENIFAIGDASIVYDLKGQIVPWTAQKAISEGRQIAYNVFRLLTGKEITLCALPKVRFIIPIGGKWAIAKLNGITWSGFFGWMLKNFVELRYLLSILPWYKACGKWLLAVCTFSRND